MVLVCDGLTKSDLSSSNTEDRVTEGGEISGTDKRGDYDSYLKPSSLGADDMV